MSLSQRVRPGYITGVHSNENVPFGSEQQAIEGQEDAGGGGPPVEPPVLPDWQRKLAGKRHNEMVKLFASGMNSLAVATLTAAVVLPLIKDPVIFVIEYRPVWFFVGVGLHLFGQTAVRLNMRSEE